MWISELTEEHLTDDMIDKVLFDGIEDKGQNADCIIVLGSRKAVQYRVPAAVKAYHEGRAPKLIVAGAYCCLPLSCG